MKKAISSFTGTAKDLYFRLTGTFHPKDQDSRNVVARYQNAMLNHFRNSLQKEELEARAHYEGRMQNEARDQRAELSAEDEVRLENILENDL